MADIRVLIVDDHPIICKGIHDLLAPAVGITVVGEAHTGAEALQKIEDLKPDVVLLDMKLPDMSGVEIIKRAYKIGSNARILGLSSYNDREFISQLLTYGAAGYLLKDEMPEEIVEAVRGVAHGEVGWVSGSPAPCSWRRAALVSRRRPPRRMRGCGAEATPGGRGTGPTRTQHVRHGRGIRAGRTAPPRPGQAGGGRAEKGRSGRGQSASAPGCS